MRGVISFHDIFAAIPKAAITEQEAEPAIREVNLVIFADSVGDYRHASAVVPAMPQRAVNAHASCESLIHFRVCKGLSLAIVPAKTAERREIAREILFQVDSEAVLARDVPRMVGNIRLGSQPFLELRNRISINPMFA